MTRILLSALAATATLVAGPLAAHDRIIVDGYRAPPSPNNDSNKWWIDYKTDISEAKRELRSDLRRATDQEDRRDAYEEYHQEIRDAKHDYRKEMRERGYRVVSFRENRRLFARR
ncbi:MAG: hypothetical protein AAGK01_07555 [Pseudomonadota bacterium]